MTSGMAKRTPRRLVFLDTETTGLADSVEEAIQLDRQVIEYAFAVWEDGDVTDRFCKKVMPTGQGLEDAIDCAQKGFNHFARRDWLVPTGEPRAYTAAQPWNLADCTHVFQHLNGERAAGSNPRFDVLMLKAEFTRAGQPFPKLADHRMLDLNGMAWPLWALSLIEKTGLEHTAKLFGIEHKAHTAMGDVEASIKVWEEFLDRYLWKPRDLRALLACLPGIFREIKQPDYAAWLEMELDKPKHKVF